MCAFCFEPVATHDRVHNQSIHLGAHVLADASSKFAVLSFHNQNQNKFNHESVPFLTTNNTVSVHPHVSIQLPV